MDALAAIKRMFGLANPETKKRVVEGTMPEGTEAIRNYFLTRPDDAEKPLTPLQQRMQSGVP